MMPAPGLRNEVTERRGAGTSTALSEPRRGSAAHAMLRMREKVSRSFLISA